MLALNRVTGRRIDNVVEHVQQSLHDIITTPINSRVIRRDYGSVLPDLIDAPLNAKTVLRLYAATAVAIIRWEPRFKLSGIHFSYQQGQATLEISGTINGKKHPLTVTL